MKTQKNTAAFPRHVGPDTARGTEDWEKLAESDHVCTS